MNPETPTITFRPVSAADPWFTSPFPDSASGDATSNRRQAEAEDIRSRILECNVLESDVGTDECTLILENHDLRLFSSSLLLPGSRFEVRLGYEGREGVGRIFRVTNLRGFRRLHVTGYGPGIELDQEARSEQYDHVKVSDVVRKIADRHHLTPQITPTLGVHKRLVQSNQTDAKFLQQLAQGIGFTWFVEEIRGTLRLVFAERDFHVGSYPHEVIAVGGEDPRLLEDPEFEADLAGTIGVARGLILDPLQKLYGELLAAVDETERAVLGGCTPIRRPRALTDVLGHLQNSQIASAINQEMASGVEVSPELQKRAADLNAQLHAEATQLSGADEFQGATLQYSSTVDSVLSGQEELDGLYKDLESKFLTARIRLQGDPYFRPKRLILIDKAGPLFGGPWYVDSITYGVRPGALFQMELRCKKNAFDFNITDIVAQASKLTRIRDEFRQKAEATRKSAEDRARLVRDLEATAGQPTPVKFFER